MGKLTRQAAIVLLFSLFAWLTLASPALAASGAEPPPQLVIKSAEADFGSGQIIIKGVNFGRSLPTVTLADDPLLVLSATPNEIVTLIPPLLPDATYRLVVSRGPATTQFDVFDFALGAVGPQGPQGVTGPAGPIGPAGPQGLKGDAGTTGPQGLQGVAGSIGPKGATGSQGVAGPAGPVGPQGPAGPKGDAGQVSLALLVGSPCIFRGQPGTVQVSITEVTTDLGVPLNIGDIHLTCLPPPPPPPPPAPDTATLNLALRAIYMNAPVGGPSFMLSVRVTNISPAPLSGPNNIVSSSPATGTCSAVGPSQGAEVACAYTFPPGSTVTVTIEAVVDGPGISGDQVTWNPANGCPRSSGSGPLVASCTIALPPGNSVTSGL